MKTYEKPQLFALALSGNEMLCGGCDHKTRDDPFLGWIDKEYGDGDGLLERSDFEIIFAGDEDCRVKLDSFCKFTSADNGGRVLFTS